SALMFAMPAPLLELATRRQIAGAKIRKLTPPPALPSSHSGDAAATRRTPCLQSARPHRPTAPCLRSISPQSFCPSFSQAIARGSFSVRRLALPPTPLALPPCPVARESRFRKLRPTQESSASADGQPRGRENSAKSCLRRAAQKVSPQRHAFLCL